MQKQMGRVVNMQPRSYVARTTWKWKFPKLITSSSNKKLPGFNIIETLK